MPTPVKIVFLGTPDFAVPILANLAADKRFEIVAVITQEDKPVGRHQILTPSPVKKLAIELNLPVFQPIRLNRDQDLLEKIQSWKIDFLVVVAYGQILSQKVLNLPSVKPINIHGSILPKYRGASPIEQSLLNSDTETGISIMEMTAKMDEGPVYEIHKIPIEDTDNNSTIRQKSSQLAANVLPNSLIKIKEGEISPMAQDESLTSYCQKISKQDGQINPKVETAKHIIGKFKAFTPWPGIFIKLQEKNCKIIQVKISNKSLPAGEFLIENKQLFLGTSNQSLEILQLQLEGKKTMSTNEFLIGNSRLFN